MKQKINVSFGQGKNRVDFDLNKDQASKVLRLQKHIRLQREEDELAKKENRKPHKLKY